MRGPRGRKLWLLCVQRARCPGADSGRAQLPCLEAPSSVLGNPHGNLEGQGPGLGPLDEGLGFAQDSAESKQHNQLPEPGVL